MWAAVHRRAASAPSNARCLLLRTRGRNTAVASGWSTCARVAWPARPSTGAFLGWTGAQYANVPLATTDVDTPSGLSRADVQSRISDILLSFHAARSPADATIPVSVLDGTTTLAAFGFDSLDVAELVSIVESDFCVDLPLDFDNVTTAGHLVDVIVNDVNAELRSAAFDIYKA